MANKKTLVLGASENPSRYSYLAIKALLAKGHDIVALGNRAGSVSGIPIITSPPIISDLDTVTVYLNPQRQQQYYQYIISLAPKRIIFNPGAENQELAELSVQNAITVMEACTLVLLSTGQY